MSKIYVLDPEVSNKIAAGEVVERPASVIKELVENSIDAGATAVTVEIKNGGSTFMRVTDNGSGMAAEDAHIAFLRHATSKIREAQDLDAIFTLGFRGEALSSIGAVAQAELFTRRPEDEMGVHVLCSGGEIISEEAAGAAAGTTFVVQKLFYNTPARMKFLKKDATEAGYISDLISRFILAHPEISFRFINNGKQQLFSPGDGSIINAVYTVYGRDYANSVLPVEYEQDGIRVSGVIGKGTLARPNRTFQSFFVNKRYIKSPMLIKALEEAYKNQIMIGKFPMAVLNVEINPMKIDINVHPTKLEVKFSEDKSVYEAVYYGVKNALYATVNVPKLDPNAAKPGSAFQKQTGQQQELSQAVLGGWGDSRNLAEKKSRNRSGQERMSAEEFLAAFALKGKKTAGEVLSQPVSRQREVLIPTEKQKTREVHEPSCAAEKPQMRNDEPQIEHEGEIQKTADAGICKNKAAVLPEKKTENPAVEQNFSKMAKEPEKLRENEQGKEGKTAAEENRDSMYIPFKIAGQVFDTYLVVQREDEMLLIDQHAAHERIRYEALLQAAEDRAIYAQILLEPVSVSLSGEEMSVFEANRDVLNEMGFDGDVFGDHEILIRSAPDGVEWADVEDLVIELLTQIQQNKKELIGQAKQRALYTIACKSAVKANHALSEREMETLVSQVLALENINTCPHGRPIMISMTKRELEKQFKRIV